MSIPTVSTPIVSPVIVAISRSSQVSRVESQVIMVVAVLEVLRVANHLMRFIIIKAYVPSENVNVLRQFTSVCRNFPILVCHVT